MNSNGKISKIRQSILLILLCCVLLTIAGCGNKPHEMSVKESLSELSCNQMSLTETEKQQVNAILQSCYYEDSEICGFVSADRNKVDLYSAVNLLKMADLLHSNEIIDSLREELSFLKNADLNSYDILNVLYYARICSVLGYSYNKDAVKAVLMKYYNPNCGTFYVFGENDAYGIQHTISKMCVEECREIISDLIPEMKEHAARALNEFQFSADPTKAFYNSGGSILVYCHALGIDCSEKIRELNNWFVFWKDVYGNLDTTNVTFCLSYSDYLDVAALFENVFPDEKLQAFYDNLSESVIEGTDDLQILYNILKSVETLNNDSVNQKIISKLRKTAEDGLFSKNIDPRTTAYALALASWTDFSYNHDKINEYLDRQYSSLKEIDNLSEKANTLYYLTGIDQFSNNFANLRAEEVVIQEAIDDVLDHLSGKESALAYEVDAVRKIVEVASDLQIFKQNIIIKEKYLSKIKNVVENALKNEEITNSVLVADLMRIDGYLGLSMIDESIVSDAYNKLKTDSGVKSSDDAEATPDVYTSFMFLKLAETDLWSESSESFDAYKDVFCLNSALEEWAANKGLSPAEIYLICYFDKVDHTNESKEIAGNYHD